MTEVKEIKDIFEIKCNEKTFISKKMNPARRALVIKELLQPMAAVSEKGDKDNVSANSLGIMAEVLSKNLTEVMWEFVKDEDKKDIGTLEVFAENVDDKNSLLFMKWATDKVKEIQRFLGESQ